MKLTAYFVLLSLALSLTASLQAQQDSSARPSASGNSGQKKTAEPADLYSKDLSKQPAPKRALVNNTSVGFVPLPEMGQATYKGETGGLYGKGENKMPEAHWNQLQTKLQQIRPLDAEGRPSSDGKVVLLVIGMSNTTVEAKKFIQLAQASPAKSPHVVIVDAAQGAQGSMQWSTTSNPSMGIDPWEIVEKKLSQNHVTAKQVQAVWIKHAVMGVGKYGAFPRHAKVLQESVSTILQIAKASYPNLQIAYLSSRIYGGYAPGGNNEPYAYESAFAMRAVILDQINGNRALNSDPAKGKVLAPLVVWGPYLWADGTTPRKSDGLVWEARDLRSDDGMHPSESGQMKVGKMLLNFFTTDPSASWFTQR